MDSTLGFRFSLHLRFHHHVHNTSGGYAVSYITNTYGRGGDKLRVNLSELQSNILSTVRRRGESTALKIHMLSPTWLVAHKYTNNLQAALLRLCCN